MQSLALVVTMILMIILCMAPIAIGLSFSKTRGLRIASVVFGIAGVLSGTWFMLLDIGIGARLVGLFTVSLCVLGIWNARRVGKKEQQL